MKLLTFLLITFCFSINSLAQIESNSIKTIDFSGLNNKEKEKLSKKNDTKSVIQLPNTSNFLSPKSNNSFKINSKIDSDNFGTLSPKKLDFGTAPTVNKYLTNDQPKYLSKEDGISAYFQRDQKLGDIRTKSKFLILKFRDYGKIDGDVIRLFVNDEIVVLKANLVNGFSQYKVNLPTDGFYKIDFMALNMGQFAPNTAQLKIIDDKSTVILNDRWALSTGFKATAVIIKE